MRPTGFLSITFKDGEGKLFSRETVLQSGWLSTPTVIPSPYLLGDQELALGKNLWTDAGRQNLAYLVGNRSPVSAFVMSSFGCGTGLTTAQVTDVALENPLTFASSLLTKPLDGVDYPAPFVARFSFTIGVNDFNGQLITELGLFSGNGTLMARKLIPNGINKMGTSPTITWRVRV